MVPPNNGVVAILTLKANYLLIRRFILAFKRGLILMMPGLGREDISPDRFDNPPGVLFGRNRGGYLFDLGY